MTITAEVIVDRVQKKIGPSWKDTPTDAFLGGDKDGEVKGVVTTFAPSLEVMRKAVASGSNMIISRESPYWARAKNPPGTGPIDQPVAGGAGRGRNLAGMENDPIYRAKRDYINANHLIVYQLFENWNTHQPDAQLNGLAKALGWEKYYKPSGGQPWGTNNGFFVLPPATLKQTAASIKKTLGMKSIRIGGDPDLRVSKIALSHGMYWIADLQRLLAEPGVDLLVMGEPQWENELCQYSFDLADSGAKKGLILLGQEVSEDPGCGEMAAWLKSFVSEVPVKWIPTGEPCWMPY
jgi:putative NIF3 family GTP cyclohydrolase 1 type 2